MNGREYRPGRLQQRPPDPDTIAFTCRLFWPLLRFQYPSLCFQKADRVAWWFRLRRCSDLDSGRGGPVRYSRNVLRGSTQTGSVCSSQAEFVGAAEWVTRVLPFSILSSKANTPKSRARSLIAESILSPLLPKVIRMLWNETVHNRTRTLFRSLFA